MTMNLEYVLYDPKGDYKTCALVEEVQAYELRKRGCATIPVDPDLFLLNGVAGFEMRHWGMGAIAPPRPGRIGTPLVVYRQVGYSKLHWRAWIRPIAGGDAPTGDLRIIADTAQLEVAPLGLAADGAFIDITTKGGAIQANPDGICIGGECNVPPSQSGYMGLAIYGQGRLWRVAWVAVSQTA